MNPIHLPSIVLSAFTYIFLSNGSFAFSLQGKKWDCAFTLPPSLPGVLAAPCLCKPYAGSKRTQHVAKPFFFHLIQVHGKKLVSFSFLEDERRWFREKWLDQGGRPNALTAPNGPTWVGTYLWWEVSLLLASFPSNPLKSLGKGSLYILLPLWFISLCMTIGP